MRAGAIVMALKVDERAIEDVSEVLRRHGGISMAYGAHWNFVARHGDGESRRFTEPHAVVQAPMCE